MNIAEFPIIAPKGTVGGSLLIPTDDPALFTRIETAKHHLVENFSRLVDCSIRPDGTAADAASEAILHEVESTFRFQLDTAIGVSQSKAFQRYRPFAIMSGSFWAAQCMIALNAALETMRDSR